MRTLTVITNYTDDEAERLSLDDLKVTLAAQEIIASQIGQDGYDVPEYVSDSIAACKRQLEVKQAADKARKLRALKQQRANLATMQEKRASLDAEIATLEGNAQAASA